MASKRAWVAVTDVTQHDEEQLQPADWLFVTHIQDLLVTAPVAGDDGKYMKYDLASGTYVWDTPGGGLLPTFAKLLAQVSVRF